MRTAAMALAILMAAGAAHAGSREVQYGPTPSWVAAPLKPTDRPAAPDAPVRITYIDQQVRLQPDGQEIYTAYRVKVLTAAGLSLGNLIATWSPDSDDFTVHVLRIIRGDQIIDVLPTTKFHVVENDDHADTAILNGNLVARLQAPGLQVGDELEFTSTLRRRESVFADKSSGLEQLQVAGLAGAYRVRLLWPDNMKMRWKATPDLGAAPVTDQGGMNEIAYELRDPASAVAPDGAPPRFGIRRMVEYSDFDSWAEISNAFSALIDQAATLKANSPIAAEADKIAASTSDPRARAEAALALVQDKIRYVYIGLNGGAYRPATADDTWDRRFGDCKAKTVLLLALLRRLGIQGEAVLVNLEGLDGTNDRLPSPNQFDHVLVRAVINGKPYWLDGARVGDHHLDTTAAPTFRWALPVRSGAADLEAVPAIPLVRPSFSDVLDIDARAGFAAPAKVRYEELYRGDEAQVFMRQLSAMAPADAERELKAYFRKGITWADPATVSWRYDDAQNVLIMTMTGEGKLEWDGNDKEGRSRELESAGFSPPAEYKRPSDQDQQAPWALDFPTFKRWTTIVRLPPASPGWRWTYTDAPVHRVFDGGSYWREAVLKDGVLRSTMSRRGLQRELTAAEAKQVNLALPGFDNAISTVSETRGAAAAPIPATALDRVQSAAAQKRLSAAAEAVQANRLTEALAALDEAEALEPENATILRSRADVLHRLGRHEAALADLDEAARINPFDPATTSARVQELKDLGRSEAPAP